MERLFAVQHVDVEVHGVVAESIVAVELRATQHVPVAEKPHLERKRAVEIFRKIVDFVDALAALYRIEEVVVVYDQTRGCECQP